MKLMKKGRLRYLLAASFVLVVLKFFCMRAVAQTANGSGAGVGDSLPAGRLYGEAGLATNLVENGITQTEKAFAIQSGLGYKWTLFRMGLWGSNVRFAGNDDTLNLRLYAAYKFIFTNNADLNVRYDFNRYFTSGSRDGNIIALDLNLFKQHILLEENSNWEGIAKDRRWGYSRDFQIPWNLDLTLNGGYNMIDDDNFSNYFDIRTTVSRRYADILYSFTNTFNSGSSQFDGRGDLMFFLGLAAQF